MGANMSQEPPMITCPRCDTPNVLGAPTCRKCGTPLQAPTVPMQSAPYPPQYPQQPPPPQYPYPPPQYPPAYQQPYPYNPPKKSSSVGWIFGGIAIGILLVVLLCVGVFVFGFFSFGRAVTEIVGQTSSSYEAKTIEQGQSGESAGWRATVNSVRREKEGTFPPSEGNEYLIVDTTFENRSNSPASLVILLNFRARDADGNTYLPSISAKTNDISQGEVAPGKSVTGELGFEVPTTAKGLMFVYDPVFGGGELRFKLGD